MLGRNQKAEGCRGQAFAGSSPARGTIIRKGCWVMKKWSKNDELFKKELEAGFKWQLRVANYLNKFGLDAEVPPLSFRDKIENAGEYADLEDILCEGRTFEVKSRSLRFTKPSDFPFETILVDTVRGWESKKTKPDAYICVSTVTGAMIVLSKSTQDKWVKSRRYDHTRGIRDWFYECHKSEWRGIKSLIRKMLMEKNGV